MGQARIRGGPARTPKGRLVAVAAATAVALGLATPPAQGAVAVNDVPERAWTVNGTVNVTTIAGDTLYVGGSFSAAVSPSGQSVTRRNVAAFSLSTGELVAGWRADTNRRVRAIEVAGDSVYLGGAFTRVGGSWQPRAAKVDATTGARDASFRPNPNAQVRTVLALGGAVYLGGDFTTAGGGSAGHLAKVDGDTGIQVPGFTATTNGNVWSLEEAPGSEQRIYVGGWFTRLNGAARPGVAAVDPDTGDRVGPRYGYSTDARDLAVSPDGDTLYAGLAQGSNSLTAWDAHTGVRRWRVQTDGDVQTVTYYSGTVYFGFHDGFQGDHRKKFLAADATTGAVDPDFAPVIRKWGGVLASDATDGGVVIGGPFSGRVSGVTARGFAIFRD